ncbi:hypothetical protein P7K49_028464 [Saguinus oedipus]|uniref:Uncharacterized protein n=1 Tax=Saguinus oedipus TaxID=9490 RepID=A0ABQ9UCL8_SAGOE|nr:hypothetical protein P7K49_028464 [Saguinus oedipus]
MHSPAFLGKSTGLAASELQALRESPPGTCQQQVEPDEILTTLHRIGMSWFGEWREGIDPRTKEVVSVRPRTWKRPRTPSRSSLSSVVPQPRVTAAPAARCRFPWRPERRPRSGLAESRHPEGNLSAMVLERFRRVSIVCTANSRNSRDAKPPPGCPLSRATRSRRTLGGGTAHRPADRPERVLRNPFSRASEVVSSSLRLQGRLLVPGDRGHRTG